MHLNENSGFDIGPKSPEVLKEKYFTWYVLEKGEGERAIIGQYQVPDLETAIKQAKYAYNSYLSRNNYKKKNLTALVDEIDEPIEGIPKRRTLWQADQSATEGHRINGNWEEF